MFLERHAGTDRKRALRDNRPFVQPHGNEMRRDAGDFHAAFVSLPIRLRAGKTRQQRRVDVDDFVFVPPHEVRRKNFHEPRQHDEINFMFFEQVQRAASALARSFQLMCAKGSLNFLARGAKSA